MANSKKNSIWNFIVPTVICFVITLSFLIGCFIPFNGSDSSLSYGGATPLGYVVQSVGQIQDGSLSSYTFWVEQRALLYLPLTAIVLILEFLFAFVPVLCNSLYKKFSKPVRRAPQTSHLRNVAAVLSATACLGKIFSYGSVAGLFSGGMSLFFIGTLVAVIYLGVYLALEVIGFFASVKDFRKNQRTVKSKIITESRNITGYFLDELESDTDVENYYDSLEKLIAPIKILICVFLTSATLLLINLDETTNFFASSYALFTQGFTIPDTLWSLASVLSVTALLDCFFALTHYANLYEMIVASPFRFVRAVFQDILSEDRFSFGSKINFFFKLLFLGLYRMIVGLWRLVLIIAFLLSVILSFTGGVTLTPIQLILGCCVLLLTFAKRIPGCMYKRFEQKDVTDTHDISNYGEDYYS